MDWKHISSSLHDTMTGVWERLFQKVCESGQESPRQLKRKMSMRLLAGGAVCVGVYVWAFGVMDFSQPSSQAASAKPKPPSVQTVANLSTPLSSVKDGDIWVSRIEKLFKDSQQELGRVRDENLLLEKRLDLMARILSSSPEGQSKAMEELRALEGKQNRNVPDGKGPVEASPPQLPVSAVHPPPQKFPYVAWEEPQLPPMPGTLLKPEQAKPVLAKKKRKVLHLQGNLSGNAWKSPETYLPAGTYFKVVTAMGVVVSTGTNSASDPQPILLRIVDNGNLPGGLKGKVRDAVLIGSCYGSASAERAICRLKTFSWRDGSGRAIEKPIEGWIASEDGVQGIRAKIIDRSSEVAREAFGAGLLSAASSFLKFEATSGVYPMTPFGQTNALGKMDALKGAAGTGVSSALDKLAEFSIKRAESMSPVAYVSSGRVLDAVLMTGVDLSPVSDNAPQLIETQSATSSHPSSEMEQQGDPS